MLTRKEAKEKMKKTFLAPSSLFGNSALSSPFVHNMTASRKTKKSVMKHNKRFQQQLSNGFDCSTFLDDENEDNNNAEYEEDEENPEVQELYDLTDILEEDDNGDAEQELQEDENDEEKLVDVLFESDEDEDSEDDQDEDLDEELDIEEGLEKGLPFEEGEDEATNEENVYKNIKITRALIERLTPKPVREKKASSTSDSKNVIPMFDSTPKPTRGRKSIACASKKNTPLFGATPKATHGRKSMKAATPKRTQTSRGRTCISTKKNDYVYE